MLNLQFSSISEMYPGRKWQHLFQKHWPAYRTWFISKGAIHNPGLIEAQNQLHKFMPEWEDTYHQLCILAGDDDVATCFLTGYQPPAYITGCSQAILVDEPVLVRNYDYHPHLCEGTLLHTAWNGQQVMGVGDCLSGLVDGMNENGLVASLTFGGRKEVSRGFGIPFILRYVLEFCNDVQEAVEVLQYIPSHMSYNVMVLDKSGNHKMVQMAPDKKAKVTELPVSTNHQKINDWPAHEKFSKTREREQFLLEKLQDIGDNDRELIKAFFKKPLYNRQYKDGFGTIYTSVYRPVTGRMELKWLDQNITQSFESFIEENRMISYSEEDIPEIISTREIKVEYPITTDAPTPTNGWEQYGKSWSSNEPSDLALQVYTIIGEAMGMADSPYLKEMITEFQAETKKRGQVPWELLADFWAKAAENYANY